MNQMFEIIQFNNKNYFFAVGASFGNTEKQDSYYGGNKEFSSFLAGNSHSNRYNNNQNVEYFIYIAQVEEPSGSSPSNSGKMNWNDTQNRHKDGLDFKIVKKLKLNFVTSGINQIDFKIRENVVLLFR